MNKEFESEVKVSHAKYKLIKIKTGGGGQSSYNLNSNLEKQLLEKNVLEILSDIPSDEKISNNGQNKIYALKDNCSFLIGDMILKYILPLYQKENNKIVFVHTASNNKFQLMKTAFEYFKNKNENNAGKDYQWFLDLFDNNIESKVEFDLIEKAENKFELIMDIELNEETFKPYSFQKNINYLTKLEKADSYNKIFFGAPGTGKSSKIKSKCNDSSIFLEYERVTFHPNYSYSQFVGSYKPVTDDKENISYEYIPGPFINVLINAIRSAQTDAPNRYLLIIEEINRANVAAVFGDMFQLLDRDEDGQSEYSIITSEELRKYLAKSENLGGDPNSYKTIRIPNNMYIWATMNSADQGVFPMDAAFKRRWNFEYLPIDMEKIENPKNRWLFTKESLSVEDNKVLDTFQKVRVVYGIKKEKLESGELTKEELDGHSYNWYFLRKAINTSLKTNVEWINEDKLLGPWFVKSDKNIKVVDGEGKESEYPIIMPETFSNKVLMYLFEDVVKMEPSKLFETKKEGGTLFFSDIQKSWEEGLKVFISDNDTSVETLYRIHESVEEKTETTVTSESSEN